MLWRGIINFIKEGTDIAPKIGLLFQIKPIEVAKKGYPWA